MVTYYSNCIDGDAVEEEGFETQIKLFYDETIKKHLGIESVLLLIKTVKDLL